MGCLGEQSPRAFLRVVRGGKKAAGEGSRRMAPPRQGCRARTGTRAQRRMIAMWSAFKNWWTRRSTDDFAAEIESHIAMEVDRLIHAGMSAEEAQRSARRTFGNTTSARENFREHRP